MSSSCPFRSLLLGAAGLLLPLAILGQSPFVGPRGTAMGGAATAVADDGTALWTNPAGLARDPRLDVALFGSGVATNRNEFTGAIDRLASIDLDRIRQGRDLDRIPRALRDLALLTSSGTGIVGSGVAGAVVGKSGVAIGIGDVAYGSVYPTVDLVRILPGNDPATGLAFNRTAVTFVGLEAREARVAYARGFFNRLLLVGATVRYIQGRTYFTRRGVFDTEDSDPATLLREAFDENARETDKLAYDVGAMLNLAGKLRVGLVGAALNEPEFDLAELPAAPASVRLPRTVRAGVAVQPIGMLTVAADYDLEASETLLPGGKSRQLSGGVEVKLPFFAVRAGAFRDSEAPDPHWAYTAGVGLGLKILSINAAVVFSSEGGLSFSSTERRDVGAAVDARLRF
ncbi:MAG: conjugal transfer protein TraF [Thermoanaerobaculia bacterium]|nr:conjugal transfer protein TraF [Thermoanaerobaculia bacterium]